VCKQRNKKILYIAPDPNVKGGISSVIKGYLKSDLSKKYNLITVASHVDGPKWRKLLQALGGWFYVLYFMLFDKISIVHIHGSDIVSSKRKYFFFRLVYLFNCKIVYHFHGASFSEQYASASTFWKECITEMFEQSNIMICLSDSWKKEILKIAPQASIEVVVNAVSLPELKDDSEKKENKVGLTFLGLIGERKGIFDLLAVMKKLVKDDGYKYGITLDVGGNGDIVRLKNVIEDLGLMDNVRFLGWISEEDRDVILRETDIFVLPSYGEGMPMAILEAMSYALPVVSTFVGGIPELVEDGKAGCLVNPGDTGMLYDKLSTLISSESMRGRFGANGRKIICERHNLDVVVERIDEIYKRLL